MTNELVQIIDASEALFKKYGIRSVTMSDIAQKLGVSKKTLYKYIENKHDLISKMMERYISEEKQLCNEIASNAKNALDQLLQTSTYIQELIKDMNPSLLYDLQKYHRSIWEKVEAFHQNFILVIAEQNLARGVQEGIYRADLNTKIMAKIYVSLAPIISNNDLFPHNIYSPHSVHKEFIKYHINGIISEKGKLTLHALLIENNLDLDIL